MKFKVSPSCTTLRHFVAPPGQLTRCWVTLSNQSAQSAWWKELHTKHLMAIPATTQLLVNTVNTQVYISNSSKITGTFLIIRLTACCIGFRDHYTTANNNINIKRATAGLQHSDFDFFKINRWKNKWEMGFSVAVSIITALSSKSVNQPMAPIFFSVGNQLLYYRSVSSHWGHKGM